MGAGVVERGHRGGEVGVGGLDLLLGDLHAELVGGVLGPGEGVLAVVALEVDVADGVALGDRPSSISHWRR